MNNLLRRNLFIAAGLFGVLALSLVHLRPYPGSAFVKIIPILCLLAIVKTELRGAKRILASTALFFSALGDIALDEQTGRFFILGLGAFTIAYPFYIYLFAREFSPTRSRALRAALLLAYLIAFAVVLWPNLGELRPVVAVYILVLATLGTSAALRPGWQAFAGASLLIFSDSLIGLYEFLHIQSISMLVVIATYYLGQSLVVAGLTR